MKKLLKEDKMKLLDVSLSGIILILLTVDMCSCQVLPTVVVETNENYEIQEETEFTVNCEIMSIFNFEVEVPCEMFVPHGLIITNGGGVTVTEMLNNTYFTKDMEQIINQFEEPSGVISTVVTSDYTSTTRRVLIAATCESQFTEFNLVIVPVEISPVVEVEEAIINPTLNYNTTNGYDCIIDRSMYECSPGETLEEIVYTCTLKYTCRTGADSCGCSKIPINRSRLRKGKIIGGDNARTGEFPWLALIEIELDGAMNRTCGGSLVAESIVVTSAHCVEGYKNVTVYFGIQDLKNRYRAGTITRTFAQISSHPDYDEFTNQNDVALILLKDPVKDSPTTGKICSSIDFKPSSGSTTIVEPPVQTPEPTPVEPTEPTPVEPPELPSRDNVALPEDPIERFINNMVDIPQSDGRVELPQKLRILLNSKVKKKVSTFKNRNNASATKKRNKNSKKKNSVTKYKKRTRESRSKKKRKFPNSKKKSLKSKKTIYNSEKKPKNAKPLKFYEKRNNFKHKRRNGKALLGANTVTIAGFGKTSTDSEVGSNLLQRANVDVWSDEACFNHYNQLGFEIDTSKFFCASSMGINSCEGDCGGPVMLRQIENGPYELAGTISFGYQCSNGVHSRVDSKSVTEFISNSLSSFNK